MGGYLRLIPILFFFGGLAQATGLPVDCLRLIRTLRPILISEAPKAWQGRHGLSNEALSWQDPLSVIYRVKEIVDAMYDPNSAMGKEFNAKIATIDRPSEAYLTAFDIFLYSPEYQQVLRHAHEALPLQGRVLDIGAGSGIFSTYLQDLGPQRELILMDRVGFSPLAARRFAAVAPRSRPTLVDTALGLKGAKLPKADHAVINQVLYTMEEERQRNVLLSLRESLPPGGTVVLNEPVAETASPPQTKYKAWLTRQLIQAVLHGAPHSDFQIALLAGFSANRQTFSPPKDHALPQASLEKMVRDCGFTIDYEKSGWEYGRFTRFLVLRRQ